MHRSARGFAMLAVLTTILAACSGTGAGSPVPSPSDSPTPPASESPTPTPSPRESESPSEEPSQAPSEPGDSPTALDLDTVVRTKVNGLRLREQPTTSAKSLGTLALGARSYVLDGPRSADGYTWYLVTGMGVPWFSGCSGPIPTDPWECPEWLGWVAAESPEGDAWLETETLDCPAFPEVVTHEFYLGLGHNEYLACYRGEELTLTGFYPEIPDDAGLGGACAGVPDDMLWIACNLGYETIGSDESSPFGDGFMLTVEPSVTLPERGQWIQVTGRYDHPAAQDCTFGDEPERSLLACRTRFVVERAEAVPAP